MDLKEELLAFLKDKPTHISLTEKQIHSINGQLQPTLKPTEKAMASDPYLMAELLGGSNLDADTELPTLIDILSQLPAIEDPFARGG